ncbi:hypothetical protein HNQ37_000965 [Lactovum miscens]|uniref:Uncharacterized protein n=1 Tax=Lactovum miscens TaxID=190387 RepID=A0A841C6I3_9LACT|nr:hypothetical protein [Lactovum miscens]
MNVLFWKQYINCDPIFKHLLVKSNKLGTMMSELVLEDFYDCKNFSFIRQYTKYIGKLFKQLDYTITFHQPKLDLLKEQNKGFMQKMFTWSNIPSITEGEISQLRLLLETTS